MHWHYLEVCKACDDPIKSLDFSFIGGVHLILNLVENSKNKTIDSQTIKFRHWNTHS